MYFDDKIFDDNLEDPMPIIDDNGRTELVLEILDYIEHSNEYVMIPLIDESFYQEVNVTDVTFYYQDEIEINDFLDQEENELDDPFPLPSSMEITRCINHCSGICTCDR